MTILKVILKTILNIEPTMNTDLSNIDILIVNILKFKNFHFI